MSYHTTIIVGNLGRDPEMRYTPSGQAVTSFSVAVNDDYTNNNGERIKRTIWFRISAWGKQAETCNQYLKKGSKVLVLGVAYKKDIDDVRNILSVQGEAIDYAHLELWCGRHGTLERLADPAVDRRAESHRRLARRSRRKLSPDRARRA